MEAYKSELERVAAYLRTVPGKVTETNIKNIGIQNHLEVFEDDLTGGKRLSFSGSIVVIDIDFNDDKVVAVNVALASNITKTDACSFMAEVNRPNKQILDSLAEPRLDGFARILEFIARCDRFSTKEVDCFKAIDNISSVISQYLSRNSSPGNLDFGKLVVNPAKSLGMALWYHGSDAQRKYAYLDVVPGARQEYSVKKGDTWLSDDGQWNKLPQNAEFVDSRAELALTLDPPIIVSDTLANFWSCHEIHSKANFWEKRYHTCGFSLHRYPGHGSEIVDFDVALANLLPYRLVSINQIPLRGPSEIPEILSKLRQFTVLNDLLASVFQGAVFGSSAGSGAGSSSNPNSNSNLNSNSTSITNAELAIDMSVADALQLSDHPQSLPKVTLVHLNLGLQNSSDKRDPSSPEVTPFKLSIAIPRYVNFAIYIYEQGRTSVELTGDEHREIDVTCVEKLVNKGHLAHAIVYAMGACIQQDDEAIESNMETN